jgi:phage tail sheath protein FI
MNSAKHVRIILADAVRAAAPYGFDVHMEPGGKHKRLVFEGRGVRRVQAVPTTPRDPDDAIQIARQLTRRILREFAA